MLHSFSFENFRSMKGRQTLSLFRSGDGTTSRLAVDGNLAGGDISPVAVIFGANASGKSTIIHAMTYIRWIIRQSSRLEAGRKLPNEAFALDDVSRDLPFFCEIEFSIRDRVFRYSFSVQTGIIATESLAEIVQGPRRRSTRRLFTRKTEGTDTKIDVSSVLTGPKKAIIAATRPNSLFLSKAAHENFKPLLEIYEWFVDPVMGSFGGNRLSGDEGIRKLESDTDYRPWIGNLLTNADLGVIDVSVRSPKARPSSELVARVAGIISSLNASSSDNDPEDLAFAEEWLFESNRSPQLHHRYADHVKSPGVIPWEDESQGTHALWNISSSIYDSLKTGRALLIDELSSLHPLLVRAIISTYQSERSNPNKAQLIFTSHDLNLLGSWGGQGYLLDRDQIWLTEKEYHSGSSNLIPLTDFSPRKEEDIEKMYLQGRYGAVPALGPLFNVDPQVLA